MTWLIERWCNWAKMSLSIVMIYLGQRLRASLLAFSLPAAHRTKPLKMSLWVDIRYVNKDLVKSADVILFWPYNKSSFIPELMTSISNNQNRVWYLYTRRSERFRRVLPFFHRINHPIFGICTWIMYLSLSGVAFPHSHKRDRVQIRLYLNNYTEAHVSYMCLGVIIHLLYRYLV